MPEELKEGAQEAPESQELAVPEISEAPAEVQQPSPAPTGQTEERLEKLIGAVTALNEKVEKLSRQEQSAKDRAISKTAKELAEVKARLDAFGGDWNALAQEAEAQTYQQRLAALEARISQAPASQPAADPKSAWRAEWDAESQKILDAASRLGVALTPDEYNAAMFGKKFTTKGDAYAALNQALLRKGAGEAIPAAAVVTEGGDVPRAPEPKTPKTFRQQLDDANKKKDSTEARRILDAKWAEVERGRAREEAKRVLQESGVDPKELIE